MAIETLNPQNQNSQGQKSQFHLSLGVKSIDESIEFYSGLLGGTVTHRSPSGYVNIDLYGTQITLRKNDSVNADIPDFHFGVNLDLEAFNTLAREVLKNGRHFVTTEPEVWDAGTAMERKKMYLKCPTGYLVELKGYLGS